MHRVATADVAAAIARAMLGEVAGRFSLAPPPPVTASPATLRSALSLIALAAVGLAFASGSQTLRVRCGAQAVETRRLCHLACASCAS